jgi:hypothetical protein
MGPKKAAPAKKGKDNSPENGVELTPEEKAKLFMLTCQSLQVQLGKVPIWSRFLGDICDKRLIIAERSEEAAKALASKREYQERVDQISKDFEEEKRTAFEITQDMTRQYKGMQEELLARVSLHWIPLYFEVFIVTSESRSTS